MLAAGAWSIADGVLQRHRHGIQRDRLRIRFVASRHPCGDKCHALVITPIDDDLVEGPETVSITLNTNSAYALGSPASALITLVDNEVNLAPSVQLVSPSANSVFLASTNLFLVLESRISDDGRPAPGSLTSLWTRVSGPAESQANFAGP